MSSYYYYNNGTDALHDDHNGGGSDDKDDDAGDKYEDELTMVTVVMLTNQTKTVMITMKKELSQFSGTNPTVFENNQFNSLLLLKLLRLKATPRNAWRMCK